MKETSRLCLLVFLGLWFSAPLQASITQYVLSEENLEEIVNNIHETYGYLPEGTIHDYLSAHLHHLEVNTSIPYPKIVDVTAGHKRNIVFKWEKEQGQEIYHVSYMSLQTGVKKNIYTIEPTVSLFPPEGYTYHIFCFSAINNDFQSLVNIFIVDRDAFSAPSTEPDRFAPTDSAASSFKNFPNPFYAFTTIAFEMPQKNAATLHLYSPEKNILIPNILKQVVLTEGRHEIPIDLSDYPPGIYFGILQIDKQSQYLQVLHLGG